MGSGAATKRARLQFDESTDTEKTITVFCSVAVVGIWCSFTTGTSTLLSMYWTSGTSTVICTFLSHRHLSLHLHKDARNLRSKVVLVKRELCAAVL